MFSLVKHRRFTSYEKYHRWVATFFPNSLIWQDSTLRLALYGEGVMFYRNLV
jgi:hypothetical protein